MTYVAFIAGLVLLLVLIVDVQGTVFNPRGPGGLITRRFYSASWRVWKRIGERLSDKARRGWLAQLGPILVPLTVVVWAILLVLSFALMYVPWVAAFSISPPESGPVPDWALVLYYSAYSAVTLGVGDVTPDGTTPRLMAVTEAGFGFALFTVSVTYLLSIYNALNQSTSLALAIARYVGRRDGESPVSLLAAVARSDAEGDMENWLVSTSFDVAALVELRGQYPLLDYFHEPNNDSAIMIEISDLLELISLSQSLLDPDRYPTLAEGPTVKAIVRLGRQFLAKFDEGRGEDQEPDDQRWKRYTAARKQLADAGVSLRADEDAWAVYRSIARKWDVADDRMRAWLGYPADVGMSAS